MVVAFADDPQLAGFLERVDAYRNSPKDAATFENEAFLDALGGIRRYGPEDRATERLGRVRSGAEPTDLLLLDLECWHSGDSEQARSWLAELEGAIVAGNGEVLDTYINDGVGLILARARLPEAGIDEILDLDQLARVDGVPELPESRAEAPRASVDALPTVEPPEDDAPLVGLVDSGVRSSHPLIAPALADATTLAAGIPDGEDAHGHGTRVAGLLLHGPLEDVLERSLLPRPFAKLLSVRVLGPDNHFPEAAVWEHEIERAVIYCADQGARVINLCIGDRETRYRGAHSTPVAALLDQLARERDLVIVVPTGNVELAAYASFDETIVDSYAIALLESAETSMLDPAPAAIALTVAATCPDGLAHSSSRRPTATRRAIGANGWPSPFSRRGPGVDQSIKPELSASGGSMAWDLEMNMVVDDAALGCLSTSGSPPERLLDVEVGTSFAAPLVARVATAVLSRYPHMSANQVRALVLQGCAHPTFAGALETASPKDRREAVERAVGNGSPRLTEAIESDGHRTVLVAEGEIPMDRTHVYEVPIPLSFFESGGTRGIDVALSFDPLTRVRRLDYMACKMEFYLVRGLTPEEIEEVFLAASEDETEQAEAAAPGDDEETNEADSAQDEGETRPTPSGLDRRLLKFTPPGKARSKGANQLGRLRLSQRLKQEDGDTYHLVVQCRRRWAPEESSQRYALAVCLWRSDDQPEIYDELRARIEVPVEVEVER